MALPSTVRRFQIEVADTDRNHYTTLDLRVAQHPSESLRYLATRVLARALEDGAGVEFSRGLCADDEPALWQRDLRGDLQAWIEVSSPSAQRLHRAQKASPRVAVYSWKDLRALASECQAIHRAEALELYALDEAIIDGIAATIDRNNAWSVSRNDGIIYLACNDAPFELALTRVAVAAS